MGELPRKPAYGDACNGCGLCCTVTACDLAVAFIEEAETGVRCPALEWEGGRSWCGLIRNPAEYVSPILWLSIGQNVPAFKASVTSDLIGKGCDSGPIGGEGPDEFLGMTAAEAVAYVEAEGVIGWERVA